MNPAMNSPNTCPKCGASLPTDAPEGLCPACLMQGGFATDATIRMTPSQKPSAPQPTPTPLPEELAPLFPQLEIIELLGRGGMGTVYKARQPKLNRFVALKIISAEAGADPQFAERFQREAQALAKLNHPNIVSVFDFGESEGLFYFLMEFVDGANLRTLIRSGEMKPEAALALIPAFCDALQYAHDEGVVHRDIKPENVLVDKKGRLKIADFGLAKLLGHESNDHSLTMPGMSLGTPRYMAPEQMDKPETVDHRADIYSLGVVFYEMLTGEIPMGRFAPPSHKVQVDIRFDEIVLHAMERDVELRYQHVSEVKTAVEKVTSKPQTLPVPSSMPLVQELEPSADPEPRLSRFALWGAIWAVLGVLVATVIRLAVLDWEKQPAGLRHPVNILNVPVFLWALFVASSVVGSSAFGFIAIGKIKRSGGKLYGLPMAAFSALFYPLLALDFVIVAFVVLSGFVVLGAKMGFHSTASQEPLLRGFEAALTLFIGLPLAAWIDFLVVRGVWRKIAGPKVPTVGNSGEANSQSLEKTGSDAPEAIVRRRINRAAIALLISGIAMGVTAIAIPFGALSPHLGEKVFALLICGPAAVFIVRGALKMLNAEDHAACKRAALCSLVPQLLWIIGLPVGIWALVLLNKPEVKAAFGTTDAPVADKPLRWEGWWFSRSPRMQKFMGALLIVVAALSMLGFLSFRMEHFPVGDVGSPSARTLFDMRIGVGDPWYHNFHLTGRSQTGIESGVNLFSGSALFGVALVFAFVASLRLSCEQKRRSKLADIATDAPQRAFVVSAAVGVVCFVAAVAGVIVHEIRNDLGPRWVDATHIHPEFERRGITSIALQKHVADEMGLTQQQWERINQTLGGSYVEFLKLENENTVFRSEHGHLLKIIKPFPHQSYALAEKLAADLHAIAGKEVIPTPERGAVWKLRLFGHAGEFYVRMELWQEGDRYHRHVTWEKDDQKLTSSAPPEGLDSKQLAFGPDATLAWESMKDILHESKPDDEFNNFKIGQDVLEFRLKHQRYVELMQMLNGDTSKEFGPEENHRQLVTQATTPVGRASAEVKLKSFGAPMPKDATPEQLVTKLEELLGKAPTP